MGSDVVAILSSMMWLFPYALFHVVALIVAIVYWQKHSGVSLTVVAAASLSLLSLVVSAVRVGWQMSAVREGLDAASLAKMLTAAGFVQTLLGLTSSGLMLFAAFGWRSR